MPKTLAAAPPSVNPLPQPTVYFADDRIHDARIPKRERFVLAIRHWPDPPLRKLAAMMGCSKRTVQRLRRELEAAGRVFVEERRISHNRNDTNIYKLAPGEGGEGDKPHRNASKANTNTNASRPAATIPSAFLKLQHENDGLKARARWWESKATAALEQVDWFRRFCQRGAQIAWHTKKGEREAERQRGWQIGMQDYKFMPAYPRLEPRQY